MFEKERIDCFVEKVLQYPSCDKCKEEFIQQKPLIVKIINSHIYPMSYVHLYNDVFRVRAHKSLCNIPEPAMYYCKIIAITKFLLRIEFAKELFKERPEFFQNERYPTVEDLKDDKFSALLVRTALIVDS